MTKVGVALLGFGNVGQSFARYVNHPPDALPLDIEVRGLADSSGGRFLGPSLSLQEALSLKQKSARLCEMARKDFFNEISEFVRALPARGVSLLVESLPTNISTGEPALGMIAEALDLGLSVVTVDKGPPVHAFESLRDAARKTGAGFGFSGTTGVGVPRIAKDDRVLEIRGVLNGTTNYVLTEMQREQRSFDEALARAQADGIAEPDPALDLDGWDTAAKILILAKALMGAEARLDQVSRIGIGRHTESLVRIAGDTGRVVRLVGRARIWQGRVRVSVAPKLVGPQSPFYSVDGASKLAVFRTSDRGELLLTAPSGRDAIAKTIADDIARIALAAR